MVQLLSEIERNPSFTQRRLASELGIALGLMNQYIKRCVKKGWVRASQVSPRRIMYFITPEGFKEKSRMVGDYLARSLTFFRSAKAQCVDIFEDCRENGWTKVALVGEGDLADIASLVADGVGIHIDVVDTFADFEAYDCVLITDVMNPQGIYDILKLKVSDEKLVTLDLLHISRIHVKVSA